MRILIIAALFVLLLPISALADCYGDCAAEQGMCIANCQGNGMCIGNCGAAHGRCVARCAAYSN